MKWSEVTERPSDQMVREFATTLALVVAVIGLGVGHRNRETGHAIFWSVAAAIVFLIAIISVVISCYRPRWLAPIYTVSMITVFPLAWLVSTLLLMVAYYLVLTPIALALRLAGRDALDLRRQPDQDSYWSEKPKNANPNRYLKQF
jgi:hypothetical protein